MTHWTDDFDEDEDAAESFVRPYTITRGRTVTDHDHLTLITMLTVLPQGAPQGRSGSRGLQPEHLAILGICRRPVAVAEVAAGLNLPVSVTKILIGDLVAAGRISARPPIAFAHASGFPDMRILEAVRDGLRRL